MKRIESHMGWTLTNDDNGDRKWITHTGEFSSGAEVDEILSWIRYCGYGFACDESTRNKDYLVGLTNGSISIFMAGTTLKQAIIRAALEIPNVD